MVTISRAFLLSATEVTQGQFLAVTGRNPSFFKGDPDRPVEVVTWYDAIEFCNGLSSRFNLAPRYEISVEGRLEAGSILSAQVRLIEGASGYRLPSEAEWEYACRAGTDTRYSFGETQDVAVLDRYLWYGINSDATPHPVGRKEPNAWGLHDMHGNVGEWCEDAWHDQYSGAPQEQRARVGAGEPDAHRVWRGGGWYSRPEFCRSAHRNKGRPDDRSYTLGFRIARDQE